MLKARFREKVLTDCKKMLCINFAAIKIMFCGISRQEMLEKLADKFERKVLI